VSRISRLTATGFAVATIALSAAPIAQAAPGDTTITPNPATPGSTVNIFNRSCTASSGTASSAAFTATATLGPGADVPLAGEAMVSKSAKPGTFKVTISCGTQTFTTTLTVVPAGAPHTGDGASLLTSGAGQATGAAMIGGAVGLGALALRRRHAARG
jgi:hypothetical protein